MIIGFVENNFFELVGYNDGIIVWFYVVSVEYFFGGFCDFLGRGFCVLSV